MNESQIVLLDKVIKSGLTDGIYYSVMNPHGDIPAEIYRQYVAPGEKNIMQYANILSDNNMLHICGNVGSLEMFEIYKEYNANVINWAVHAAGLSLKEGKEIFKGKVILDGFDNSADGILYSGTKESIEKEVENIVSETGRQNLIIGADCTIPPDIDMTRIEWVRRKAATM
jgi:uroporphyrinogen decarboxylase